MRFADAEALGRESIMPAGPTLGLQMTGTPERPGQEFSRTDSTTRVLTLTS